MSVKPCFGCFASYEAAADLVAQAHRAAGFPRDDSGIKRLLVALEALGLIEWPAVPVTAMAPTVKT